jgi:hypothetical protein
MGEIVRMPVQRPSHTHGTANIVARGVIHMVICRPLWQTDLEAANSLSEVVDSPTIWKISDENDIHPVFTDRLGVCPEEPAERWHYLIEVMR